MPRRERSAERRATLFAREDLPRPAAERRDAVAGHLANIAADGAINAFDVVHWAKRVPVDGRPSRERTLAERFREWADGEGVSLGPCFDTRRCYDGQTGRKRTELVMPVLCLAVYDGDEIVEVAPRATDETVVTVDDALERLGDWTERNRDGTEQNEDGTERNGEGDELVATTAD